MDTQQTNWNSLPPVIRGSDVQSAALLQAVYAKILKRAGGNLYYNLVRDAQWERHLITAVKMLQPNAVVVGPSVLHGFGCQTQIPGSLWLATPDAAPPAMPGINWRSKPASWFREFLPSQVLYGLPSLSPRAALDEAQAYPSAAWEPDFDDIDMDEVDTLS